GAGHGRLDRRQAQAAALRRDPAHPWNPVRLPAGRGDPDHGRPAVLPRPGPRPDRGALPGAPGRGRALTRLPGDPEMTSATAPVHLGEKRRSAVASTTLSS